MDGCSRKHLKIAAGTPNRLKLLRSNDTCVPELVRRGTFC